MRSLLCLLRHHVSLSVVPSGAKGRLCRVLPALAAAALVCLGAVAAQAQNTCYVTSTSDSADAAAGGTLRYCLTNLVSGAAANTNIIDITATGTITLTKALPEIENGVTINGPGANQLTISGAGSYNIFSVSGTASISGLTIADGSSPAGGIFNGGALTVNACAFSGNTAGNAGSAGGGITNTGTLTVTNSTFSGNTTGGPGGGIFNAITLTVSNSTFSGNTASGSGGGIYNAGTLTVTNSTFSGNTANGSGGGIFSGGTLTAYNNLFDGNTATSAGAGIDNADGTANGSDNVYYKNLTGATETDCNGCSSGSPGADGNFDATSNPLTLPLGYYGGTTETYLPQPGSAAICAGSDSAASSASLTADQRGFAMNPSYNPCAAGSVDAGAVQTNYVKVEETGDGSSDASDCPGLNCTLRDAVGLANNNGYGDIDFIPGPSSITLSGAYGTLELSGTTGINIIGPGATSLTISGGNSTAVGSVFTVSSGATATIYGLTVADGNQHNEDLGGGGIDNGGTLTVLDSAISGNQASNGANGGGINSTGALTVTGSTISGNTAGSGGGIASYAALTVTGSTISGNSVTGDGELAAGGGIFGGSITLTGSTVTGNTAICSGCIGVGGGIAASATVTLADSIVAGNSASSSASYADIFGSSPSTSGGGNVVGTSSSGTSNVNPQLSPLQYNGIGATLQTMIPLPGSPAICAGLASNIPSGVTTDERGYPNTNTTYSGYSSSSPCVDAGAVQTDYTSVGFVQQPSNVNVSTTMSPAPTVQVLETDTLLSTNNTDAVNGAPVTVTLASGTFSADGTGSSASAATSGGVATFSGLQIGTPEMDDTFLIGAITVVGSDNLAAVTSSEFNVYGQASQLAVSAPATAAAGTPFNVTVTAEDTAGNVISSDNDTVKLTITGTTTQVGAVTLNGGTGSASVTLTAAGTVTLTGTDTTTSLAGPSGNIVVSAAASAYQVAVSGYPTAVYATVPETGAVSVEDQYGNTETSYSGTVLVTTSESATAIPVTIINGVGTFSLSFATSATNQSITASMSPLISVPEAGITVNAVPSFVVGTINDDANGVAGNCSSTASANCTLRDALAAAQSTGAGNISFDAKVFAASNTAAQNTITLGATGPLTIPSNTTITGATTGSGATLENLVTVSGGGNSAIFGVYSGVTSAAIANLIITDGLGIDGGGITNSGTLTVTGTTISGNSVHDYGAGGGIYNQGTLTMTDSTVSGNSAPSESGGGIYNQGTLTVTGSTFSGNSVLASGAGGGIFNDGTLTVTGSTFSGNAAPDARGSGIYNYAQLTATNNVFSNDGSGGECVNANDSACATSGANGNIVDPTGTLANLAALGNYGGPTRTMIALPGSAAICAGVQGNIPSGTATDQRGFPHTNATYSGYSGATPCVDAGAVQTNYSLSFTAQPSPISPATTLLATTDFQAGVTLDESGSAFTAASVSIPLALTGNGTLSGGTASTANGVASYSALQVSTSGTDDQLTASLALNSAPAVSISAESAQFSVGQVTPTLSFAPSPASQIYGTAISLASLNATARYNSSAVAGTFAYTTTVNGTPVTLVAGSTVLPAGNYAITAAFTPSVTSIYEATSTMASYTVNPAPSSTTLSVSSTNITPNQSVTLTAQVTSAAGTPAGTVNFYDGTTLLSTVSLSGGVASYSITTLAPGVTHTLTATYSGNNNFMSSSTTASTAVTVAPLDFTMTIAGPSSATVVPGSSITYQVTVTPDYGSYAGAVNFAVSGLPPGATVNFSPSSIAANGGPQTVTVTIQTPPATALLHREPTPSGGRKLAPFTLAFLLLFGMGAMRKRVRALRGLLCVLLLTGAGLVATMLSGCGSNAGFFAQAPQNYAVTITATAGPLEHTTTVTLNVQ